MKRFFLEINFNIIQQPIKWYDSNLKFDNQAFKQLNKYM